MITKEVVYEHLKTLGIPAHIKGFKYLMEAILEVSENETCIESVTKVLYPDIARKFNSTTSRVDRSIRHAIEFMHSNTDPDVVIEYFGNTISMNRGKVTNSQFIAGVVAYIKYGGTKK